MSGRFHVRAGPLILATAAVAAVLGLLTLGGFGESTGGTADASPSPSAADASRLATYSGEGYAFEYPASWHAYPLRMTASFFTVAGYLASEPIDTSKICTSTPNSTSCNFRGYDLDPGQVVVEIAAWGTPMDDPLAFWDRPAEGRRILVGGMPAIVTEELAGPDRIVTTWKVARPDVIGNWIQLDADVRGPGDGLARADLQALVQSFRFDPPPTPLDPSAAGRIGNGALASLHASDPEAYACFPPAGKSVRASVTAAPGAPLRQPLEATCSTAITATDLGFWRLQLTVAWGEDPLRPNLRYTTVQWLQADGTPTAAMMGGDNLPNCCRG